MKERLRAAGAPLQPENTDSIKYNLGLAEELSALFARMQSEGNTDEHTDAILERYNAINVHAEEESMSDSDRIEPNDALDVSDTRDEILGLIRPIATFLKDKGKIN